MKLSRRSERVQKALPEIREGSGGPSEGPTEVRRHSQRSVRGLEALP